MHTVATAQYKNEYHRYKDSVIYKTDYIHGIRMYEHSFVREEKWCAWYKVCKCSLPEEICGGTKEATGTRKVGENESEQ